MPSDSPHGSKDQEPKNRKLKKNGFKDVEPRRLENSNHEGSKFRAPAARHLEPWDSDFQTPRVEISNHQDSKIRATGGPGVQVPQARNLEPAGSKSRTPRGSRTSNPPRLDGLEPARFEPSNLAPQNRGLEPPLAIAPRPPFSLPSVDQVRYLKKMFKGSGSKFW